MKAPVVAAVLLVVGLAAPASGTPSAGGSTELVALQSLAPPSADGRRQPTFEAPQRDARYPWLFPRATRDRPDEKSGNLVHVVYLLSTDFPDERLDRLGILHDSALSINAWLAAEAGHRWRFDTYTLKRVDPRTGKRRAVTAIDVTFVQSLKSSAELNDASKVRAELKSRGFFEPEKRYLSYVASDAATTCGDAWYPVAPGPIQISNEYPDGKYAQVYLFSSSGCHTREFATGPKSPSWVEAIAQQELVHNDGVVPATAPHSCGPITPPFGGHVCTPALVLAQGAGFDIDPENVDVMFPYITLPLGEKVLDRDRDDYFQHSLPYRDLTESPYLEATQR